MCPEPTSELVSSKLIASLKSCYLEVEDTIVHVGIISLF